MVPTHILRYWRGGSPPQTRHYWESVGFNQAKETFVTQQLPFLNRMMRKFAINNAERQASFFGNAIQETIWLAAIREGNGPNLWYAPWFGRGFLQLTNPENYINYWRWLGREIPEALKTALVHAYQQCSAATPRTNAFLRDTHFPELTPQMIAWRDAVGEATAIDATGSAGFYWAKLSMARYADQPHVLERVSVDATIGGVTHTEIRCYYRSPAFWRNSASVNLPGVINNLYSLALNGFADRCCAYGQVLAVAGEYIFPSTVNGVSFEFPEFVTPRRG